MHYSEELRMKVVERALGGSGTQDSLAEEFGVSRSSIQNWMRKHRASGATALNRKDKRPQSWTKEERLEVLLGAHGLCEGELGAWCRERGIHTHHLAQWRRELVEGTGGKGAAAGEMRALRQEVSALKKELRRKDKALAETAALLVLKKKAASIWGEVEDD
jgi:transposase-like protein